jgi:hypothetical protein
MSPSTHVGMSLPHCEEVGHPNERDASELGNPSPNSGPSRSPPSVSERHTPGRIGQYKQPPGWIHPSNILVHPVANTSASFFSGGYERQVVTVRHTRHILCPLACLSLYQGWRHCYNSGPAAYIRLNGYRHNHTYPSFFRSSLGITWNITSHLFCSIVSS